MGVSQSDNSIKNLPISNPKPDLHNINAHTKFGENLLCLLKLSSGNENGTDRRTDDKQMDGQTDRLTDDQRETIIPRHYCVAGYNKCFQGSQSPNIGAEIQSHYQCQILCIFPNSK